eukprot:CAMPEP_0182573594 /NCGR_PEP_ID=MMETSP1324-20130603/20303_1 /TAXON_ID=236786 /ORGANISM="Florenciella sp., Strain RCC1587" /LENGTH=488 /DNA_ID=CAMNT_0024788725 /DNA_START=35 /DNA_END=1501 /DNA_ORIENTATION=-
MPDAMDTDATTPEPGPTQKPGSGFEDLRRIVSLISRAVDTKQTRLVSRALRHNSPLRTGATSDLLTKAVELYFPEADPLRAGLLAQIAVLPVAEAAEATSMDVEGEEKAPEKPTEILPEVSVYLSLLVINAFIGAEMLDQAQAACEALVTLLETLNRRTLDPLTSKAYFYLSLVHEKKGTLPSIRTLLLSAHRTACLHHDEMGQATLLNLLLRNLLSQNLVEQAYKLGVKLSNFPEKASNNQFCRYLYYTGRISALQLEYGDAYTKLLQSLRKAPQNTAAGFRRTVQKLMVIVQLLMGEVPERSTFNHKEYRAALAPYLVLTQAVRAGDLLRFNAAVAEHAAVFKADKTYTLVIRLSHNVIKTGLRRISVSYSRVSMEDICAKLHLDSPQSAEFVCAKAIRDGVIDAVIDHENGWMTSKELTNVYATNDPQRAFHKRINFCLNVHNEAVRAMVYPPVSYKKKADEKKDDEPTAEEIAKEIEEELAEEE